MENKQKTHEGKFDAQMREGSSEITPFKAKEDEDKILEIEFYKAVQALRKARRMQSK
jgi:hypothetical protein